MRVYLEDVPERYVFYLKSGKKVSNIKELAKELDKMEDGIFYHHVTAQRNDFHNWIRDIVLDIDLAEKILNAKTAKDAGKIVSERIKFIESQIKPLKKAKKPSVKKKR